LPKKRRDRDVGDSKVRRPEEFLTLAAGWEVA